VVVEDGDIFGDGINVAARLKALAEPGGICVSARVQEDAVGKLDLAFEDMGERALKNIARPVRAYRVAMERRADCEGTGAVAGSLTHGRQWSWLKAWGIQVAQRRGMRRAIVAVARRLPVVLHRMWVDGSEFRWRKDGAAVPAVA